MSKKSDYTPEEWNSILAAPYHAAMLIVVSDFNISFYNEIGAMMQSVLSSVEGSKNELIREAAADLIKKENQDAIKPELDQLKNEKDPASQKKAMLNYAVNAADLVSSRSSEDGQAFREWLLYLAQKTAEGSKEGGFLGIGGVRVSDQEQAALDELADALGANSEV